jgi:hypothetical protein
MRTYVYEACVISSSVHEAAKIEKTMYNVTVIY